MDFENKKELDLDELDCVSGGVGNPTYMGKACKPITLKPDETPLNIATKYNIPVGIFKRLNPHVDLYLPCSGMVVFIPAD